MTAKHPHRGSSVTTPSPAHADLAGDAWGSVCARREGTLVFRGSRGRQRLPVLYSTGAETVFVQLADFNEAANYLQDQRVQIEVDVHDPSRIPWKVTVTGHAHVCHPASSLPAVAKLDAQWPDTLARHTFEIPVETVCPAA